MAGYTRQSIADIINGADITAPPVNAEFNQITAAFNGATGHSHDGSTGNAPKIDLTTSVSGYLPAVHGGIGGKNNFAATTNPLATDDAGDGYAPGSMWENTTTGRVFICVGNTSNAAVWRELVQVQTANKIIPETTNTVDLGDPSTRFQDLWLAGGLSAFGNGSLGGTLTVTGATALSSTLAVTGDATFANLTATGTSTLTSVDVNSGAIDSTAIGNTTPAAGTFTTLNANTSLVAATADINGGTIDGATIGASTPSTGAFTTISTSGQATLASADINGGSIDGATVGATSHTSGKFTTLQSTGQATLATADINGGAIDGTTIGTTTPSSGAFTTVSASGGVTGDLTGDVTGNVTGNITGAVTGNVTGNLTGNVTSTGSSSFNNVTIDGTLNMNANTTATVTNLTDPTNAQDAATKNYVDTNDALKLNLSGGTMSGAIAMGNNKVTNVATPTASSDAATKGYVDQEVSALVDAAPGTLDTLNELAAALGDDPDFATTVTDSIATKLPLAGGTMSGDISMGSNAVTSTANPATDDELARKGYVDAQDATKLSLSGGTMSGEIAMGSNKITGVTDPTAAQDAATKAYVDQQDGLQVTKSGDTMSGNLAMGSNKVTGLASPTDGGDATNKTYVDGILGSATAASASAAAAATSESNAATSETNASNSASAAATSEANAAASYDNFDDRYLGAKASAPTVDNDGDALIVGALYFNSTNNIMYVYGSGGWQSAGSAVNGTSDRNTYTATAGQTVFAATYDTGYVDVYLNGVKLLSGTDFTATNGTSIALASGATLNDVVDIVAYGTFVLADHYTKLQSDARYVEVAGDTMTGDLDVQGTITSDGLTVDGNNNIQINRDGVSSAKVFWNRNGTQDAAIELNASENLIISVDDAGLTGKFLVLNNNNKTGFALSDGNDISFYDSTGITPKFFWDASDKSLGVGMSSPSDFDIGDLVVGDGSGARGITIYSGNSSGIEGIIRFADGTSGADQYQGQIKYDHSGNFMRFYTAATERMRINSDGSCRWTPDGSNPDMTLDASGNLLVGTTDKNIRDSSTAEGMVYRNGDSLDINRSAAPPLIVNRVGNSDGDLVLWRKDGSTVGSIGTTGGFLTIGKSTTALKFADTFNIIHTVNMSNGADVDGVVDLGYSGGRFRDLHLSGTANAGSVSANTGVFSGFTTTQGFGETGLALQGRNGGWATGLTFMSDNANYGANFYFNPGNGDVYYRTTSDASTVHNRHTFQNNGAVTFNEGGADADFRVESDTDTHAIFVDAGNNRVNIHASSGENLMNLNAAGVSSHASGTLPPGLTLYNSNTGDNTGNAITWKDATGAQGIAGIASFRQSNAGGYARDLRFYVNNSAATNAFQERLRIDRDGNITMGSTLVFPGGDFRTASGFRFRNAGDANYLEQVRTTTNDSSANFYMGNNVSSYRFFSFNNNTSQIGSISNSGNNSVSYNTTSDYRLKENVEDIADGITRVKQLQPRRFSWISEEADAPTVDGFIAHEAQMVVPEAIHGTHNEVDDDGNPVYQGIDQAKLVPLLTAALQEALTKIEAMEARLAALEGV